MDEDRSKVAYPLPAGFADGAVAVVGLHPRAPSLKILEMAVWSLQGRRKLLCFSFAFWYWRRRNNNFFLVEESVEIHDWWH